MPKHIDEKSSGVFIIAATPFLENGAIDYASVDSLVEFYIEKGVSGMTILGMMGEAHELSSDESTTLMQHFLDRVQGRVPVVVGVSNSGITNLGTLAKTAMDNGASGVMVAPNASHKTEQHILNYFKAVCAAVGPDTPVCFQDFPLTTRAPVSAECLVKLFELHPQIVMLKHEDWPGLQKLSKFRRLSERRVSVLVGNGGLYLPQELARGADGAMTGFAYPELLVEVIKRHKAGEINEAEDLFDLYLPLIRHEQQPGFGLSLRKETLRRRGAISYAGTRAPGGGLDKVDLDELGRLMDRLDTRLAAGA